MTVKSTPGSRTESLKISKTSDKIALLFRTKISTTAIDFEFILPLQLILNLTPRIPRSFPLSLFLVAPKLAARSAEAGHLEGAQGQCHGGARRAADRGVRPFHQYPFRAPVGGANISECPANGQSSPRQG